jgi:hypothetical protein
MMAHTRARIPSASPIFAEVESDIWPSFESVLAGDEALG